MFQYGYCYFLPNQPRSYQQFQMPVVDAVDGMVLYIDDFVVPHHKNMSGCICHDFHLQHQLSDGFPHYPKNCSSTKPVGNSNVIVNNQ